MKYYLFFYGENRKKEVIYESNNLKDIDELTSKYYDRIDMARNLNLWDCTEFGINKIEDNQIIEEIDIYYQKTTEDLKEFLYNYYKHNKTENEKFCLKYWLNIKNTFEIRQLERIRIHNEKALCKVKKYN